MTTEQKLVEAQLQLEAQTKRMEMLEKIATVVGKRELGCLCNMCLHDDHWYACEITRLHERLGLLLEAASATREALETLNPEPSEVRDKALELLDTAMASGEFQWARDISLRRQGEVAVRGVERAFNESVGDPDPNVVEARLEIVRIRKQLQEEHEEKTLPEQY